MPGAISFVDADDPSTSGVVATANGAYAVYEFVIVATEHESWGSVKALYR